MRSLIYIALLLALTGVGCSRPDSDGGTPLPRRYAYPRFEPYDTVTEVQRLGDLSFHVNAAATVAQPRAGWMDVSFPRYGATLHLSFTRPGGAEALADAIANRRERMMLNLGDATAEALDYRTPAGFVCSELATAEAAVTPVQFLAVGPDGRLLSGAVALADPQAPTDSIAPIIAALKGEVRTLLRTLIVEK